jgi:hypothetical protein
MQPLAAPAPAAYDPFALPPGPPPSAGFGFAGAGPVSPAAAASAAGRPKLSNETAAAARAAKDPFADLAFI